MLTKESKNKIDAVRDTLVGKIPDPKGQIDQITTALIYKFMDDADRAAEKNKGKATFFVGDMERFAWHLFFIPQISNQAKADLYVEGVAKLSKAAHLPQLFRDIFKDAFVPFRAADTIAMFLDKINEFPPYHNNSEELGNAFEYLLHFMGTQGDAGQFRTPHHIIDFIVEVVAPAKGDKILDPACGTAGFLVSAYKHIAAEQNKLTQTDINKLARNIFGVDIDPQMAKFARVNLYLHGFRTPKISEDDTLTNEELWGDKYNVILTNPPFMTPRGGIQPHDKFGIKANRSEVLFVDYIAEHLLLNGRAGVIVPEGIIFQAGSAYKQLRKNLVESWGLFAVVSLPGGVFNPYSGVKTSILLLDREFSRSCDKILFVKVENDGHDLGAQRRKHDKDDLPAASEVIKQWKETQRIASEREALAHSVGKKTISEDGEYNLTGERYREAVDYRNAKWPMVELGKLEEERKLQILRGQPITKKQVIKGDIPVIAGGRVPAYFHNQANRSGSVITISGSGYAGFVNFFVQPIFASDCITIQSTSKDINISFICRLLKSRQKEIYALATGVAQVHVYPKDIRAIKIPLPPLEVQEQIAAEIDAYQKVIDGAKQVVAHWQPQIKINSEWEEFPLDEVCIIESGSRQKGGALKSGIHSIGGEQIRSDGSLRLDKMRYISEEHYASMKKGILKNKDVLIVKDGATTGKVGYFNNQFTKGAINEHVFIFRAKNNILPYYLYKIMQSHTFQKNLKKYIKGIIGGISLEIKNIQIPLPPLEVQEKIVAEIEAEQQAVESCKTLIAKMEQKIAAKIAEVWGG